MVHFLDFFKNNKNKNGDLVTFTSNLVCYYVSIYLYSLWFE